MIRKKAGMHGETSLSLFTLTAYHLDFSPVQCPITTCKDISSVSSSWELISDEHLFSKKN